MAHKINFSLAVDDEKKSSLAISGMGVFYYLHYYHTVSFAKLSENINLHRQVHEYRQIQLGSLALERAHGFCQTETKRK